MKSPLVWLVLVCVASAPAWAVQCGDILGPGGSHTLTADLTCLGEDPDPNAFLTLIDGAVLDLQGFTIFIQESVLLRGRGTTIKNGSIVGCVPEICSDESPLHALDEGHHRMEGLTIMATFGPSLSSDHNRLLATEIFAEVGAFIGGHRNLVKGNIAHHLFGGFDVDGTFNVVAQNLVINGLNGITVFGDRNLIIENASEGGGVLEVQGQQNILVGNRATGGELDADDLNGNCDANWWIINDFTTANPPCILEGSFSSLAP